jgi:ubiquinone/menaquinone biosynthesis C-methylase UbiE
MSSRDKNRDKPSERDLAIWAEINQDLLDWLYTGPTGHFQSSGHRVIDEWGRKYSDGVVLEVGCGHGHHLLYGRNEHRQYIGLDVEYKFLCKLRKRFEGVRVVNGDAYALPFRDHSVDCVLSVYCFEHLRQLEKCLREIKRVLRPSGELLVGLPAEGGLLYGLGRRLTSKRYMEQKYKIDYNSIVQWEHWHTCKEVIDTIKEYFHVITMRHLPFLIPSVDFSVIVLLRACP